MTETNTTESESETADSQLIERVRQLEAQVQSQQSTIERLMPSRRDVLKAGAGVGVGAVALSGSSSGSTGSAGTIGSASDRPDIFADDVDTNSIKHISAKQSGDEGSVSFTGLSPGEDTVYELFIRVSSNLSTTAGLNMSVNGGGQGQYQTITTEGQNFSSVNGIEVARTNNSDGLFSGRLSIQQARKSRVTIGGPINQGDPAQVDRAFLSGGLDNSVWPISSIEFSSPQSGSGNFSIEATLSRYEF